LTPDTTDANAVWLALPSRYSMVVRSPLANDDQHRVYWTNPGDQSPHFATFAEIQAGNPHHDLGIVQPTTAPHIDLVNVPSFPVTSLTWTGTAGGQLDVVVSVPTWVSKVGDIVNISGATNDGTGGNAVVNGDFSVVEFTDSQHFLLTAYAPSIIGAIDGSPVLVQQQAPGPKVAISLMSWDTANGGTLYVIMTAPTSLVSAVGDTVGISGAVNDGIGGNAAVNGEFTVNGFTDSSHFTLAAPVDYGVIGNITGSPVLSKMVVREDAVTSMVWAPTADGQTTVVMTSSSSTVTAVGDTVTVSGATNTGTGGDAVVNGQFTVAAFTDPAHFILAMPAASVFATIGGAPIIGIQGVGTLPQASRSYLYTYVNSFGEESSPSPASNAVTGFDAYKDSGIYWQVSGLPTAAPVNPAGTNYPAITKMYLYRTVTSATSGAQYYYVTEIDFPASSTYLDYIPDTTVSLDQVLETVGWANPPAGLDGLVSLPGGMLAGFTGNTIHFCEPNRPHTWPGIYDQSVHYDVVQLAVWQGYLVVMTNGFPVAGSGNTPSNFLFTQTQVAEPCIARGSVLVDTSGVYYASQNGLVFFTGYAIQNITLSLVEKNEWLNYYHADNIICARHRMQYIAVNGTDQGFLVDYAESRLGFEDLTTMLDVVCIWNDEHLGDVLLMADKKVYRWDSPSTPPQTYHWKSKAFFTPLPISLGAVQIALNQSAAAVGAFTLDTSVLDGSDVLGPVVAAPSVPLDNGDVTLPMGVNAMFTYNAGPQLVPIMTRNLAVDQEIFRLPNGFKTFQHQFEVTSRVPIFSIQVATTLEELKTV
jgi:hypothetical protein